MRIIILFLLLSILGCLKSDREEPNLEKYSQCVDSIPKGELTTKSNCADTLACVWNSNICIPMATDSTSCSSGYNFNGCALGSCYGCKDCVQVCWPDELNHLHTSSQ